MTIQEKLYRFGETMKLSAISRRAGLRTAAISEMIAKGGSPSAERALRLSRALGVSVEWLIDDTQGWPPVWQRNTQAPVNSDTSTKVA